MNQREFFNSMAEKWDNVCKHDSNKINQILDYVCIEEGEKILDVGTGTGVLIPFLYSRTGNCGEIIAIDVSEKMLDIAKGKYNFENVKYVNGDVLEIDLPEGYFDKIICYSVFPHFDDKQLAVSKVSRYLKKGGKFVICHSQSRKAINELHKNASEAVSSDNLPEAGVIKSFFTNANMDTVVTVDNSEMFVVIAQK